MSTSDPPIPDTAWDIQVDQLVREYGETLDTARDRVILYWLSKGDTRPFTAFVETGHTPCKQVIIYLAWMMNPAPETESEIPYSLKITQRGRVGRRRDPENDVRDDLIRKYVDKLREQGLKYDAAIDKVADLFLEDLQDTDPRETVEKAYKKTRKRGVNK